METETQDPSREGYRRPSRRELLRAGVQGAVFLTLLGIRTDENMEGKIDSVEIEESSLPLERLEREIPKELSTNPRIDHFLRESFVAWSGNAPVERAQVLGFGDKHSDLDDALTLWALLGSMVRDEDILLVESTSDEKAQAHPLVMVLTKTGKHPTVHGWDDAKLAAEHDQAMHELHDLVKEANETRDITRHTVILRRVTAIKLRILRIGKKRNNRLLDYVSNARADDKRVFISAGLLHFAGESRWKPLLKDTPYLFLSPKAAFKTVSKLLKMEE